ncbi:hypothetical protein EG68_01756 [Paragonimus skrjabini miyazakii]|uniref:Uncharacterized protein n=1 Tax=Paragonimus skrjabini miyazakii TaxID=59628 RepID=A0A8S9Z2L3_9TREM|nr:hypothetical protein EG68_01756 [Paragonimus skrjabini miyazakii]
MRTEAEIAGIRARLKRKKKEFEEASGVLTDSMFRLGNYVEDCRTHFERRSATEPVESNPPDMRLTVVDNVVATALQPLVKGQELFQVELTHFDDHPVNYRKCAHQFRFDVESKVEEDSKHLVYLLNCCKGRAKETITECIDLPPTRSLERARKILSELFGRTHQVSQMLLDRPLNDCKVATNRSDALANSTLEFPCNGVWQLFSVAPTFHMDIDDLFNGTRAVDPQSEHGINLFAVLNECPHSSHPTAPSMFP